MKNRKKKIDLLWKRYGRSPGTLEYDSYGSVRNDNIKGRREERMSEEQLVNKMKDIEMMFHNVIGDKLNVKEPLL